MNIGWICPRCGEVNAPHLDTCRAADCAAHTLPAPQIAHNSSKVLGPENLNDKGRAKFNYTDPSFVEFWNLYPLRRGKAAAFAAWQKAMRAHIPPQIILAAVKAYNAEMAGKDPQFIKWPQGWLNEGRWDDEPVTALKVVTPRDQIVGTPEWQEAQDAEYERLQAQGNEP